jgi:arylsulfatase A-like enzyme
LDCNRNKHSCKKQYKIDIVADEKAYRSKVLAAHAAMIEDMDSNVGRVIKYLKDSGQYDNTIIIFTSDNGSSEPIEMKNLATIGIPLAEANKFYAGFNNSVSNIGNANSLVNYGACTTIASYYQQFISLNLR